MSAGLIVSMCSMRCRRPACGGRIHLRRIGKTVEHFANGPVAQAVDHDLPAAAIQYAHHALELFRRVVGRPCAGDVLVRLEHERRVGFDHAVHEHLDDAGLELIGVRMALPDGVERVGVSFGQAGIDEHRVIHAKPQRAIAPRFVEHFEIGRVPCGVGHAGDPESQRFVGRPLETVALLFARRCRNDAVHQRHRGRFLQQPRRLACHRIVHDFAARRIRRVLGNAGQGQRQRVDPDAVAVETAHHGRPIGYRRVQLLARRYVPGKCAVAPAASFHPRGVGMFPGEGANPQLDLRAVRRRPAG